ncbi:g10343 [Coccomyxa viridis]|uniref:G10343 protein n=1 Tax=Coccomyxa viridis TaxID=1274662 RepID=A0ABP1G564_9CHLO
MDMEISPGKFQRPRSTPMKRVRSPESRMQTDSLLSPTRDRVEDSALDIRSHKRFLSESMATDMRRLNMALEDEAQGSCKVASSPSVCSMQTDRDDSIGCASPAISDCFNPFESSSVHSRESPRPPLGGLKRGARGPAAPAVSPSKWVPGQMNPGSSPPMCRTPLPRPGPHPYRRPSTPGCEAGERLPPSPSDPTLSVDLRKTALLRSLLLRTEEKCKPTPCKTIRRRSRMSEAMPGGLPTMAEEPSARRVYAQLCSGDPSGSQDMETAASHSSDEECSLGDAKLELGGSAIFNFSDAEDLGAKQRASLLLCELSKQDLDPDLADGAHLRRRL